MRKIGVYCDMCGCNITHDGYQRLVLGRSRCVDLCATCYIKIEDKIINLQEYIECMSNSNGTVQYQIAKED